jgi:AmiR/NasT family two-component response regulator
MMPGIGSAGAAEMPLLKERAVEDTETRAEELQDGLTARVMIEQAKGAVAQAHGVSVEQASAALRNYARKSNLQVAVIARSILVYPENAAKLPCP